MREAHGRVGIQLEPGDSRGGRVLQHQPGRGGGGRIADAQHPGEALGLVGLDLQHLVVGGVQDSGAGGAALQAQVLPEVGYQGRGSTWVVALATPATASPAPSTVTPLTPPLIIRTSSPILAETALVRSPV